MNESLINFYHLHIYKPDESICSCCLSIITIKQAYRLLFEWGWFSKAFISVFTSNAPCPVLCLRTSSFWLGTVVSFIPQLLGFRALKIRELLIILMHGSTENKDYCVTIMLSSVDSNGIVSVCNFSRQRTCKIIGEKRNRWYLKYETKWLMIYLKQTDFIKSLMRNSLFWYEKIKLNDKIIEKSPVKVKNELAHHNSLHCQAHLMWHKLSDFQNEGTHFSSCATGNATIKFQFKHNLKCLSSQEIWVTVAFINMVSDLEGETLKY